MLSKFDKIFLKIEYRLKISSMYDDDDVCVCVCVLTEFVCAHIPICQQTTGSIRMASVRQQQKIEANQQNADNC